MRVRQPAGLILFSLLWLAGCGAASPASDAAAADPRPAAAGDLASDTASEKPRVVFLGDSLTAGLGLPAEESYPSLLQQRMREEGFDYSVVNAGVSGDTSAGGLRRFDWSTEGDARVLVLALGANDGLRGLPPAEMKKNLAAIIERAQVRGIAVVLAGMEAPPNYGREYTAQFRNVFSELAAEYRVAFIPFLLQGVGGEASLNQRDGIHPNSRGAEIVADTVWTVLKPVLAASAATR